MDNNVLIEEIKKKDLDVEKLASIVIDDKTLRDKVVTYATTSKDIMLYYHSYYIISNASKRIPHLFYNYWDDFEALLDDNNSYKRDIGMTIMANLVSVDVDNKFERIFDKYISLINDKKFMTAECCINNLKTILISKEEFIYKVVNTLLRIDKITSYTIKQTELLKSIVLEVFSIVYYKVDNKSEIDKFIDECLTSISPKTRKTAKKIKETLKD